MSGKTDRAPTSGMTSLKATTLAVPKWIEDGLAFRILGVTAVLLLAPVALPWRETLTVPLSIVTRSPPRSVVTSDSGILAEIMVADNAEVQAGQTLAQMGDYKMISDVDQVEKVALSALESLNKRQVPTVAPNSVLGGEVQNTYDTLCLAVADLAAQSRFGGEAEKIAYLQQTIASLRGRVHQAQEAARLVLSLVEISSLRVQNKEKLSSTGAISNDALAQAREALVERRLTAHTATEEADKLQAEISTNEAELSQVYIARDLNEIRLTARAHQAAVGLLGAIQHWREKSVLRAPISGRTKFPTPRYQGQALTMGDEFAVIVPSETEYVAVGDIPRSSIGDVKAGSEVRLEVPNYPAYRYGYVQGRVDEVSDVATNGAYNVRITFPSGLKTTYGYELSLRQRSDATGLISVHQGRVYEMVLGSIFKNLGQF